MNKHRIYDVYYQCQEREIVCMNGPNLNDRVKIKRNYQALNCQTLYSKINRGSSIYNIHIKLFQSISNIEMREYYKLSFLEYYFLPMFK